MIKYQAYTHNSYFCNLEPTEFKNGVQHYKAVVYENLGDGMFKKKVCSDICPNDDETWIDKYGEINIETLIA